ncbi:SDR family oxidoreductase [Anaerolineae bacterium CFX9]|nr:SDR family oxidoreductase [Kamptonema cortianum]MDL1901172.1 SDR family oxidoreductase [Anaerolineae bacterium CFX9]
MSAFQGKRVVVTGAGQGIGYGLCRAFAQAGAFVALNDADPALAQQAAGAINREIDAERVRAYPADIADVSAVTTLIDNFADQHGGLEIVIANAGITRYMPFLESTPEIFDRVTSVNLRGTYFTAQAGAKRMIASKIPGRILLTSSIVGMQAYPNFSIYGMTKAALQMLARSLALELGEYGITVNTITPGATLTERVLREDPNYEANWAKANVTGRVGYVEDVVEAALFLASPGARQITGHNLVVDGGWSIRSPLPEEIPTMPERQDYA